MKENVLSRIIVEAIFLFAFVLAAWYMFHPELDLRRYKPFKDVLPVPAQIGKGQRRRFQLYGCLYAMIAIVFLLFLVRDLTLLVPWIWQDALK